MQYSFIMPCDFLNKKLVDEQYEGEFRALKSIGAEVFLVDIDDLSKMKKISSKNKLIYRGWMLDEVNYGLLELGTDYNLLTTKEQYLYSHHLPRWYQEISDLTFESFVTTEEKAIEDYMNLGWGKVFVKDYVKSLKTGFGSVVESKGDLFRCLGDMKKYRGTIEGGVVLRRFEGLVGAKENRYFVFNGEVFGNYDKEMMGVVEIVADCHSANFFSVDVVRTNENKLFVVEIGDGQVSEAIDWKMENFIKIFSGIKIDNKVKSFGVR